MFIARIVIFAVLGVVFPFNSAEAATSVDCPAFSAHRGDHLSNYTEESLPSMVSAIKKGASWIDMDVRPSKDGGLFLKHDGGFVETHSSSWLKAHNVPTLRGVLMGVKQYSPKAFVEIKNAKRDTYARAVSIFKDFGIKRVTVTSYSRTVLNDYRRIYPKGFVSLNVWGAHDPSYFKKYQSATINKDVATPEYVASLKNAGLPVYVFTPNTATEWDNLPNVDGIITDNIDDYNNYCEEKRHAEEQSS